MNATLARGLGACLIVLHVAAGCRASAVESRIPAPASADGWPAVALDTLAGRSWILSEWDGREAASTEARVTLRYGDGRFTGRSGCNRYNAVVTAAPERGAISVGAVAGTRMMCSEPAAGIEARFLAALARAQSVRMRDGRLGITYVGPKGTAMLVFDETRAVAS